MKTTLTPIINASDLLKIYKSENIIIIDASNGKNARDNYNKRHLDGAMFIDVNTQLSDIKDDVALGGRHPLPSIENFIFTISHFGIKQDDLVVIYDDKNGSNAAARFWWMLKSVGHPQVQVLNGGFQAAEKLGFPINSKKVKSDKVSTYIAREWMLPVAEMDDVEKVSQDKLYIVVDVRETARYNGEIEPIDLVAGHIPGSINVPFTENLDADGLFLSQNELKMKYEKLFGNIQSENTIVHCGSGVTACHTILAIVYAGLKFPKLYVGSWSEWSRNNKKMVLKNK